MGFVSNMSSDAITIISSSSTGSRNDRYVDDICGKTFMIFFLELFLLVLLLGWLSIVTITLDFFDDDDDDEDEDWVGGKGGGPKHVVAISVTQTSLLTVCMDVIGAWQSLF